MPEVLDKMIVAAELDPAFAEAELEAAITALEVKDSTSEKGEGSDG